MPIPTPRPFSRTLAAVVLACVASVAAAQALPQIDLSPHFDPALLRADLADPVRAATAWLFEEDEYAISVWVWRVPGDPDPVGLFEGADWAAAPDVLPRDLGEAMVATVEVFGPYFDEVDPTWSERAVALAERLGAVELVLVSYSVIVDDGAALYGVQVTDAFVDLATLELIEGTWVQVARLAERP